MEANPILLQKKYARIITYFAVNNNMTNREALDFFYKSITYKELSQGMGDIHCRSDEYIADILKEELLK